MNRNEVVKKLKKARALLDKGWTQGTSARNALSRPVDMDDPGARSFCMLGAMDRAGLETYTALYGLLPKDTFIHIWNDAPGRTKDEIIAVFDWAIGLAQAGYEP